jgi:hypothetical protein
MTTGEFRLNPRLIKERTKAMGMGSNHAISLRAGVSHPTIAKWLDEPETVDYLHLKSLAGILVDAMRMTPAEALEIRLGDILDFRPFDEDGK